MDGFTHVHFFEKNKQNKSGSGWLGSFIASSLEIFRSGRFGVLSYVQARPSSVSPVRQAAAATAAAAAAVAAAAAADKGR